MTMSPRSALALLSALLLAPAAVAQTYFGEPSRVPGVLEMPVERVPGRAIVKLRDLDARRLTLVREGDEAARRALLDLEKRAGVRMTLVRPLLLGWGLYDVRDVVATEKRPTEEETARLIEVLRDDEAIADITEERWYRALRTPNDPGYDAMWHLDSIGAEAAWDMTTGTSTQRVGVVDTGTRRTHEDLSGKDITGYDFISNGEQGGDGNGRDPNYNDEGDGADCGFGYQGDSWHGSHVAGTILASANNGAGIPGINWSAGLVTARALGKCGGSLADIMDGAAWLAGADVQGVPNIGADRVSVMNLSLGGPGACSGYEQDVIDFINQQGVIFVAAAGNDGGAVGSPASCTGVITVAAHGPGAARPLTNYSSFGNSVEVVAPGGAIQSASEQGVLSLSGPNADAYAWQQGTSMASPHVTGAVSLMQALDPSLTRAEINALFQQTGVDCQGCQGKKALVLDAALAAITPTAPQPEPDPPPQPEPTPTDDAFEENDSFDAAPAVDCGAGLDLFAAPSDQDWFSFAPSAGTALTVAIDAGDVDLDLYITDGPTNDDVIASSTTYTGRETVELVAPGGSIAIAVAPWEQATGPYTLTVTCVAPSQPDPTEPDPTEPDPSEPDPTEPNPSEPDPTEPDPSEPDPTQPDPTEPEPEQPTPDAPVGDDVGADRGGAAADLGRLDVEGGCAQSSSPVHGVPFAALALLALFLRRRRR